MFFFSGETSRVFFLLLFRKLRLFCFAGRCFCMGRFFEDSRFLVSLGLFWIQWDFSTWGSASALPRPPPPRQRFWGVRPQIRKKKKYQGNVLNTPFISPRLKRKNISFFFRDVLFWSGWFRKLVAPSHGAGVDSFFSRKKTCVCSFLNFQHPLRI